jgi:hypothetical protein
LLPNHAACRVSRFGSRQMAVRREEITASCRG